MGELSFEQFDIGLERFSLELTSLQREQFREFYSLLIEWNSFMNLTGITEWEEVVTKHFIDSLSIVSCDINMTQVSYLIDVGTGAGFPGIPLKILFPHIEITLLDSLNKRLKFLDEVILRLGLKGISTVHGRAEELGHKKEYREHYDICVSRAVANMTSLAELSLPFVKTGGVFVAYKSDKADDEVKDASYAFKLLGASLSKCFDISLDNETTRKLFVISKTDSTPNRYPRKPGLPLKEPLLNGIR